MSPREARIGLMYVRLLRSGNTRRILASSDSAVINAKSLGAIRKLISLLPTGPGTAVNLVNESWELAGRSYVMLTYEVRNSHAWAELAITLSKHRSGMKLEGFRVQQFPAPPEQIYGLRLRGKPPLQYAALALALVIALITWFAAFTCALTPYLRFKWLWMIGIFIGLARFQLNWLNGASALVPIAFFAPPATLLKPAFFSSWILQMSLPLAAIVFLTRRKALTLAGVRAAAQPQ